MFDPNIKILVVDDMSTMRKIVMKNLQGMGYKNFVEAADGIQAWEALTIPGAGIDLIISDWNMPKSTGLDLLKRVRADGRFKAVPFLLVTAENEASQVMEALKAGVSNYVVKPFTAVSLKEKLEATYKKYAGGKAA